MAASNLNLGKASGGVLNVQPADGTTTTNLVLPAINGTVVAADSNGNVGIGTTPSGNYKIETPYNYLGSFRFGLLTGGNSGANYPSIGSNFRTTITSNSYLYDLNNLASMVRFESGGFQFLTAPSGTAGNTITWTNAMTLDANSSLNVLGNVVAGTAGGNYAAPGSVYNGVFATNSSSFTVLFARTVSDTNPIFFGAVSGNTKAQILANGNFQSATNSYGSTSDAKLKENVQDASPKLDKLMQVQVRTFNYIGQEEKQIGVVAQEIEKIFPSIVYETKDTKQVEVEKEREVTLEDGTVDIEKYTEMETVETGEVTKNVKYSVIYMMMLKGLQEMRAEYTAEINDLKSRIEILEAK